MERQKLYQKEICIYCMGEYGIRLCYALMERGYPVCYFGDADERKWGYAMNGISCIPYEEVGRLDKEKTVLVVAKKNPEKLIQQWREQGFLEVYSDQEIMRIVGTEENIHKDGGRLDAIEEVSMILHAIKKVCYPKDTQAAMGEDFKPEGRFREGIGQLLIDCTLRRQHENSPD